MLIYPCSLSQSEAGPHSYYLQSGQKTVPALQENDMAKKISSMIEEWMSDFGPENGYELSRSEFIKEGSDWYLRVYVDKLENGGYGYMSSDDCEIVSRYLSDRLDEADPIKQNYYLEVSSPGLDRPLISDKDFIRFTGSRIEVRLYEAINGKKLIEGELTGLKDGIVTVRTDNGEEISLPKEKAAKINLAVVF